MKTRPQELSTTEVLRAPGAADRKRKARAAVAIVTASLPAAESILREMVETVMNNEESLARSVSTGRRERWLEPKKKHDGELSKMKKALNLLRSGREYLKPFTPADPAADKRADVALSEIEYRLVEVEDALREIEAQPTRRPGAPPYPEGFYVLGWIAIEELMAIGIRQSVAANAVTDCLRPLLPARTKPVGKDEYEFTGKSFMQQIRKRRRAGQTAYKEPDMQQGFDYERICAMLFGGNSFGPAQVRAAIGKRRANSDSK